MNLLQNKKYVIIYEKEMYMDNSKIMKELQKLENLYERGYEQTNKIKKTLLQNPNMIKRELSILSNEVRKINKQISSCEELTYSFEYKKREKGKDIFKLEVVGEWYHFELDELLPHQMIYDGKLHEVKYYYDKHELYSDYSYSLKQKKIKLIPFLPQEKVMILFIHHFKNDKKDLDNLDPKVFIDAIVNRGLIVNDSFGFVSHMMIGKKDKKNYTEIWIGEERSILNNMDQFL